MFAPYLAVALGGSIGAIARYVVVIFSQRIWGLHFPFGTIIVNALGSFLAGFLIALLVDRYNAGMYWRLFFFTGFLGAFTTFSSFAAETLLMFEQGQWLKLSINILVNNIGALTMVLIGSATGRYLNLSGNLC